MFDRAFAVFGALPKGSNQDGVAFVRHSSEGWNPVTILLDVCADTWSLSPLDSGLRRNDDIGCSSRMVLLRF
jgi:hypothetical protein